MRRLGLLGLLLLTGCVAPGILTDGTSVSMGRADRGLLRGGRAIPTAGDGFVVPPTWVARGSQFGTDEMVAAIARAAGRVAKELPGGTLGVGDLSQRNGGNVPYHRSHENGRDADLLFYSVDDAGQPLPPPDAMPRYRGHKLRARSPYEDAGHPIGRRYFDVARNWALVAALLSDASIDVEYLFVSNQIRDALLEHAVAIAVEPDLLWKARRALRQPAHVLPHDDHLHLRIRCDATDILQGCVDEGKIRLRSERVPWPRTTVAARTRL